MTWSRTLQTTASLDLPFLPRQTGLCCCCHDDVKGNDDDNDNDDDDENDDNDYDYDDDYDANNNPCINFF